MYKEKVSEMSHEGFFKIKNTKGIYFWKFFLDVNF
jgi:hypothetical protein